MFYPEKYSPLKRFLLQKKAISKLIIGPSHDVGLVDGGDPLASVPLSVLKGISDHTSRIVSGNNFHALNHPGNALQKKAIK